MNRRLCTVVIACATFMLSGCTSNLRGTWYYQSDIEYADEMLYLTIVNDRDTLLMVDKVDVNAEGDVASAGWSCHGLNALEVLPGQLVVVSLPITKVTCAVPVTAKVISPEGRSMRVDLPLTMPSALPKVWRLCPHPTEPEKTLADASGSDDAKKKPNAPRSPPNWTCDQGRAGVGTRHSALRE